MEPPGGLPPDRDRQLVLHQQQPIQQPSISIVPISGQPLQLQQNPPSLQLQPLQQLHQSTGTISTTSSSTSQVTNSTILVLATGSQQTLEKLSRPMAFDKMESVVREMQDPENGVPVRQQKIFLTSIPYAFMGYDLIEWLMDRLSIEESEALNIANQLCFHGYFFPVNDTKSLVVKDDSSLYRFQTPYYWPWQHKAPDNVEYAIYLAKRSLRNKQRHGLEDYESDALTSLNKNLKGKWDFISMQAEEQVRLAKERKKGDKIVGDSQERAYWRVHRPPPGQFTPLEPCPVPLRDRKGKKLKKKVAEDHQREVDYLKKSMNRTRMKMSQACESLVTYSETFSEYDFFLQPVLPSNPWVTEDVTFWQLNNSIVDIPTEKRVKRWAISIEELVSDPTGLAEFTTFLEKEYSHENIRFWIAVNRLRRSAHSQVARKVNDIYEEFLKPGAPCEINIDGKTMEVVQKGLKNPTRFTFDAAAEHIYMLLLKKDCYPRFIRSEHYKNLLATGIQPSHKKRFFNFGGVGVKKKISTTNPAPSAQPNLSTTSALVAYTGGPSAGNLTRRRGSDRSLTGSAHELAVIGVKDVANKVPHSHSQSNLSEIPYGRELSKPVVPKLETTVESCSVCPWDNTEEPSVSTTVTTTVQVCPWDDDTELPTTPIVIQKPTAPSTSNQTPKASTDKLLRNSDYQFSSDLKKSPTPSPPLQIKQPPEPPELDIDLVEEDAVQSSLPQLKTPSPQQVDKSELQDETNELLAKLKLSDDTTTISTETKEIQTDATSITTTSENSDVPIILEPLNKDTQVASVNSGVVVKISVNAEKNTKCEITLALAEGTNEPEQHLAKSSSNMESMDIAEVHTAEIKLVVEDEKDSGIAEGIPDKLPEELHQHIQQSDELSPTTEEYQEGSEFSHRPNAYDYDIAETSVTVGCVAPAPTPAPSLAPLAEIEADVVDDELEILPVEEEGKVETSPTAEPAVTKNKLEDVKKKRKKRGSDAKKLEEAPTGSTSGTQGKTSEAERNAVCPWEDEDDVTTSDATFVKTYATFGYL